MQQQRTQISNKYLVINNVNMKKIDIRNKTQIENHILMIFKKLDLGDAYFTFN